MTAFAKFVQAHFSVLFPLPVNAASLDRAGQVLMLGNGPLPGRSPVKVTYVSASARGLTFRFLSLPGHFEGAGKRIQFQILKGSHGRVYLRVRAWGPDEWWQRFGPAATFNETAALFLWQQFATNLTVPCVTKPVR
jgi:uncharacterized protein (UPF0548 family)